MYFDTRVTVRNVALTTLHSQHATAPQPYRAVRRNSRGIRSVPQQPPFTAQPNAASSAATVPFQQHLMPMREREGDARYQPLPHAARQRRLPPRRRARYWFVLHMQVGSQWCTHTAHRGTDSNSQPRRHSHGRIHVARQESLTRAGTGTAIHVISQRSASQASRNSRQPYWY